MPSVSNRMELNRDESMEDSIMYAVMVTGETWLSNKISDQNKMLFNKIHMYLPVIVIVRD
jgi:hypothetical protein